MIQNGVTLTKMGTNGSDPIHSSMPSKFSHGCDGCLPECPRPDLMPCVLGRMGNINVSMFSWQEDRQLPPWSGLLTICLKGTGTTVEAVSMATPRVSRDPIPCSLPEGIPSLITDSREQDMGTRKTPSNQELPPKEAPTLCALWDNLSQLLDSSGKIWRLSQSTHDWQRTGSASV